MDTVKFKFKLSHVSVRDLPKVDMFGHCDPYLSFNGLGFNVKTEVKKSCKEATFTVNTRSEWTCMWSSIDQNTLDIELHDKEKLKWDRSLGTLSLNARALVCGSPDQEHTFTNKKGKPQGTVSFRLESKAVVSFFIAFRDLKIENRLSKAADLHISCFLVPTGERGRTELMWDSPVVYNSQQPLWAQSPKFARIEGPVNAIFDQYRLEFRMSQYQFKEEFTDRINLGACHINLKYLYLDFWRSRSRETEFSSPLVKELESETRTDIADVRSLGGFISFAGVPVIQLQQTVSIDSGGTEIIHEEKYFEAAPNADENNDRYSYRLLKAVDADVEEVGHLYSELMMLQTDDASKLRSGADYWADLFIRAPHVKETRGVMQTLCKRLAQYSGGDNTAVTVALLRAIEALTRDSIKNQQLLRLAGGITPVATAMRRRNSAPFAATLVAYISKTDSANQTALRDADVPRLLAEALATDDNPVVRNNALIAVGNLCYGFGGGTPDCRDLFRMLGVVSAVSRALDDGDRNMKMAALSTIEQMSISSPQNRSEFERFRLEARLFDYTLSEDKHLAFFANKAFSALSASSADLLRLYTRCLASADSDTGRVIRVLELLAESGERDHQLLNIIATSNLQWVVTCFVSQKKGVAEKALGLLRAVVADAGRLLLMILHNPSFGVIIRLAQAHNAAAQQLVSLCSHDPMFTKSLVVTLKSITHISAEHIPELSFAVERLLDGCRSGKDVLQIAEWVSRGRHERSALQTLLECCSSDQSSLKSSALLLLEFVVKDENWRMYVQAQQYHITELMILSQSGGPNAQVALNILSNIAVEWSAEETKVSIVLALVGSDLPLYSEGESAKGGDALLAERGWVNNAVRTLEEYLQSASSDLFSLVPSFVTDCHNSHCFVEAFPRHAPLLARAWMRLCQNNSHNVATFHLCGLRDCIEQLLRRSSAEIDAESRHLLESIEAELSPFNSVDITQQWPQLNCSSCQGRGTDGVYYHCVNCPKDNSYGFNHCSKCETRAGHNNGHVLIKLAGEVSFMDRLPCGEREFYGESLPSVKGGNHNLECSNCHQGIRGTRYSCVHCDAELCEECEMTRNNHHDPIHAFAKFEYVDANCPRARYPLFSRSGMWMVSLSKSVRTGAQSVLCREDIFSQGTRHQWKNPQMTINALAAIPGTWAVAQTADSRHKPTQLIVHGSRFSEISDEIESHHQRGWRITNLAASDTELGVVMSEGVHGTLPEQRWYSSASFPLRWIEEQWRENRQWVLTDLASTSEGWVVVMSKGWIWIGGDECLCVGSAEACEKWIKSRYEEGYKIIALGAHDHRFGVVMARNTLFQEQRFLLNSNFQEIERIVKSSSDFRVSSMGGTTANTPLSYRNGEVELESFKRNIGHHSSSSMSAGSGNLRVSLPAKEEEEEEGDENMCVICWSNDIDTVLLECGHMCCCNDCAKILPQSKCPVCRARVVRVIKVFKA